jgi:hypothetical protein
MPFGKKVIYNGVKMKSAHEAAWAEFLDGKNIPWEYEPVHFGVGYKYTPDFSILDRTIFIEVKSIATLGVNQYAKCTEPLIMVMGMPNNAYYFYIPPSRGVRLPKASWQEAYTAALYRDQS